MRVIIALAAAAAIGCVPKKDYEALQAELQMTQGTLAERDASLEESQAKVATLEEALAAAEAEQADLSTQLEAKEADLTALRSEKAALVKDKSRLRSSVSEMEAALADLARRKEAADARVKEFRKLLRRFKKLIDAGRLQVRIVDGRMVVQMATDVLFASGKAELSEEGKAAVAEVAEVLGEIPDRRYQIEGHTDDVPIKTAKFPSNWELAAARAIGVVKAMVEAGVAPERVSAASFSQYRPVAGNDSKEGKSANRRIEIVVSPDLSQLPGFEELNALSE